MKAFVGFLVVVGLIAYYCYCNPAVTPFVLFCAAIILGILIFWALVCYGISMLRLFFKI